MNKPVWESLQEVFDRAVAIAKERNQARGYGDSWRSGRTGVRGLVAMCDHKTTRLTNQLFNTPEEEWPLEEALDSALDNVNYSAFVAILLMERIAGQQPVELQYFAEPSPPNGEGNDFVLRGYVYRAERWNRETCGRCGGSLVGQPRGCPQHGFSEPLGAAEAERNR